MNIYVFAADPELGFVTAYFTVNGQRHKGLVMSQAGRLYVRTGATITHDLQRHNFSATQTAAYNSFVSGEDWSVEYKEGIS